MEAYDKVSVAKHSLFAGNYLFALGLPLVLL